MTLTLLFILLFVLISPVPLHLKMLFLVYLPLKPSHC